MQPSQGPVDRGVPPLQWQKESHRETRFRYGVYLQANLSQNFHGRENIRETNKTKKQIVSLRKMFCISCQMLSLSL